jgi:thiamine pyrophosphokinase
MVREALDAASHAQIIAADGGARVARYYDLMPDTVIGDMDSLTADEVQQLENRGVEIQRYPVEKDSTDLELALKLAADRDMTWIRVIGGLGGRFDQMLANVYLLALDELQTRDVALVAGEQRLWLLREGTHALRGTEYDTVSLLPVGGDVHGLSSDGLKYALNDETLCFGPARGISNVMLAAEATLTLREGLLLCVHTRGRA